MSQSLRSSTEPIRVSDNHWSAVREKKAVQSISLVCRRRWLDCRRLRKTFSDNKSSIYSPFDSAIAAASVCSRSDTSSGSQLTAVIIMTEVGLEYSRKCNPQRGIDNVGRMRNFHFSSKGKNGPQEYSHLQNPGTCFTSAWRRTARSPFDCPVPD